MQTKKEKNMNNTQSMKYYKSSTSTCTLSTIEDVEIAFYTNEKRAYDYK